MAGCFSFGLGGEAQVRGLVKVVQYLAPGRALFQSPGRHRHGAVDAARRDRDPGLLGEHIGGALVREQLILGHVHGKRRHTRPVLHRRRNPLGKGAALLEPAGTGPADDAS